MVDFRARKLFNGYDLFGSIRYRLDALLSTDGGRLVADTPATLALCNAAGAGEFTFRPGKHIWILSRMLVLVDSQSVLDAAKYGMGELSSGFKVTMKDADGEVLHRFNPKPITRIADWALLAGQEPPSSDKKMFSVLWSLFAGGPISVMDAGSGHYFSVEQPEAPSGIVNQFYVIQGFRITPYTGPIL